MSVMEQMPARTRRSFTDEFKRDAVAMVLDDGNRIADVARRLGIGEGTLGELGRPGPHRPGRTGRVDHLGAGRAGQGERAGDRLGATQLHALDLTSDLLARLGGAVAAERDGRGAQRLDGGDVGRGGERGAGAERCRRVGRGQRARPAPERGGRGRDRRGGSRSARRCRARCPRRRARRTPRSRARAPRRSALDRASSRVARSAGDTPPARARGPGGRA